MKRLGGWWRLWIALSVPLFIGGVVSLWPSPATERGGALERALHKAKSAALIASTRKGIAYEIEGPDGETYQVVAPPDVPEADVIDYVRRQLHKASPSEINEDVAVLEAELARVRSKHRSGIAEAIGGALILPTLLLAIGLTFAWVKRGFRRPRDDQSGRT